MKLERHAVVRNDEGMHFRPIMRLVDTAARFTAKVVVHCGERKASASSPMELLMLMGTKGAQLRLEGEGDDAEHALEALVRLIESGFDE